MAAIHIFCPICGQKLAFEPEALRTRMTCPRCANGFVPIDTLPRERTLPAIAASGTPEVEAPDAPPGPLAGQGKTILMPPNGGPLPPAEAAGSKPPLPQDEASAAPTASPPVVLPPLARPPVFDDARTFIKAPPKTSSPAPLDDALAATAPAPPAPAPAAELPHAESAAVAASPPAENATVPADAPAVAAQESVATQPADAATTQDAVSATVDDTAPAAGAAPPPSSVTSDLAALVSLLPRSASGAMGLRHVAIASAAVACLSLALLALTGVGALRWIGGFIGTLSLAAAALSGVAFGLARSRKEPSPAPPSVSPRAKRFAIIGVASALLFGTGMTSIVAAATGGPAAPLRMKHLPPAMVPPKPDLPPEQRADYKLKRDGHVLVMGGLLYVPPKFRSDDGEFDVYMHFHGNPAVVKESAIGASLNAIVYAVNLGNGSGPYEDKYSVVGVLEQTIGKIQETVKSRGLRDAKVRRVALGSWSAGYGALAKLLDVEANINRIDSVLVMDGIHAAYLDPKTKAVDPARLAPFSRFAKLAAEGKRLFTITHSEIGGMTYASTSETADALLREVGAERSPAQETPPRVTTPTLLAALPKPQETWLVQTTEAKKGGLHVRGYSGQTPDQHMAHLVQMSVTVMPELAERWR